MALRVALHAFASTLAPASQELVYYEFNQHACAFVHLLALTSK